jgi:hypothetical protein
MRAAIALLVVAGLSGGLTVALAGGEESLGRIQDRVYEREAQLAREGIYVIEMGPTDRDCVFVGLLNPTPANVEYLKREFGRVCVGLGGGVLDACPHYRDGRPSPRGPVVVPDVRELGLQEAQRRVVAAGLTYAIHCLGDYETAPERLHRDAPERLVRIVAQCPRAGERVRPGAEVALRGAVTLPGGFRFDVGPRPSCADGRTAVED